MEKRLTRKKFSLLVISTLMALSIFVALETRTVSASPDPSPENWYVKTPGFGSMSGNSWENAMGTIENAITNASPGDSIIVGDGTYTENLNVDKENLTIRSENGADLTIVQTPNPDDHVFEVTANGVSIIGFTAGGMRGSGKAGIFLSGSNFHIENNTCENNSYGIYLYSSSYDNLINNTCENNYGTEDGAGIYLFSSNYNVLEKNTCEGNSWGIYLDSSSNNTISNNNCSYNRGDCAGYGIYLSSSDHNILNNNICENNYGGEREGYGIYLYSSSYNTLDNNNCSNNQGWIEELEWEWYYGYGIYIIESSSNSTISNNNCSYNGGYYEGYGIYVSPSSDDHIILGNNTCSNNWANVNVGGYGVGIYIRSDSLGDVTLENNTCENNSSDGISLYYSSPLTNAVIRNNTCSYNSSGYGIYLFSAGSADNATIENNTCENNGGSGIYLSYPSELTLFNATLRNNWCTNNSSYGIYLEHSDNSVVENNTCENNSDGIYLNYSTYSTLINNNCSNNTSGYGIYVYADSNGDAYLENNICENNPGGIYIYSLFSLSSATLRNNACSNNTIYDGIHIEASPLLNATLKNNTCSYNSGRGIYVFSPGSSENATLENNTCNYNSDSGMYLSYPSELTLSNATLRNNWCTNNGWDDEEGYGIYIYSGSPSEATLENNTCENNYSGGIYLSYSSGLTNAILRNNNSNNNTNGHGIYLYSGGSEGNAILENNSCENNSYGIYLDSSSYDNLINNTCENNSCYGIYLYYSQNITMDGNKMSSNHPNFGVFGDSLLHFIHDINNTNLVDAGPILYLIGKENNLVINQDNQVGWLGLVNSDNMLVENLTVESVMLAFTQDSRVKNVTAKDSDYGILLLSSNNNTLSSNTCKGNSEDGISLYSNSSNNTLTNNICENNSGSGICLLVSDNNILDNNICENNDGGILLGWSSYNNLINNTCSNNSYGILLSYSPGNTIENSCIDNNGHGIYLEGGDTSAIIRFNRITSNVLMDSGIHISDGGNSTGITVNYNDIAGNSTSGANYGVYNGGSGVLNAENNWWGDASGPGGVGPGSGDNVSEKVDYDPWLPRALPVISNLSVSATATSATVSWTTLIPANSRVDYGTTSGYGLTSFEATLTTSHSVSLGGLSPSTTYHFRVQSGYAHLLDDSGDLTFTTFAWKTLESWQGRGETPPLPPPSSLPPTPPNQGTLTVDTTPIKANVYVDGSLWGTAPQTRELDAGVYTVSFGDVLGYLTPAPVRVVLSAGEERTATGVYTEIPPELIENQSPAQEIALIEAGENAEIEIENTAITGLTISVKSTVANVQVCVQQLAEMPAGMAIMAPGATYKYLNIVAENITDEDVGSVIISFKVERSWVASENIDENTIKLYRYNASENEWEPLPTWKIDEDAGYLYFSAESPGLSTFTVTGEVLEAKPLPHRPLPLDLLVGLIATIVLVGVGALYWLRFKPGKKAF